MKILIKTAFLFSLCTLLTFSAFANNGTEDKKAKLIFNMTAIDADRVKVQLANLNQSTARITIKSLDGITYYSERVSKHNGYLKILDISNLPNGRYVLKVSHDEKQYRSVVLVDETAIWFSQVKVQS